MRNFILGFLTGAATYHFTLGGVKNNELVTELRGAIKKLDDRLAEAEKTKPESTEPPTVTPTDPPTEPLA